MNEEMWIFISYAEVGYLTMKYGKYCSCMLWSVIRYGVSV